VWRVQKSSTNQLFAMKEMSKARIVHKRSVHSVINERKLLAQLRHPFLVNMSYAFQDRENLYLTLDLLTGGDLRFHMMKRKIFTEEESSSKVAITFNRIHNSMHNYWAGIFASEWSTAQRY
jgi:serum/glucocorticoid-regulated kinase 2